jgi:hypothetical protein
VRDGKEMEWGTRRGGESGIEAAAVAWEMTHNTDL